MTKAFSAQSPFARLRDLLGDDAPGADPIDMSIGSPKHAIPDFVRNELAAHVDRFRDYPPIAGDETLRGSIADWMGRRFRLSAPFDPELVLTLNGSREGLFSAAVFAVSRWSGAAVKPAVLIPNPYYHTYAAVAALGVAEPVFLSARAEHGFLPDLDALAADTQLLTRTAVMYLANPTNPEGRLATRDYLHRAIELARTHDFLLIGDECYSEIYDEAAPVGLAQVALAETGSLSHILVVNSLSKRSNLAGLRSGFCAGDPDFIRSFMAFRNIACPQVSGPLQAVSARVWSDEAHVEANRALYREKFDIADRYLNGRFGYVRPPGGFFLWLDMKQFGGGEAATVTLWKRYGVKVVPGAYLAQTDAAGFNPGLDFVRVALVSEPATAEQALERLSVAFD